MSDIKAALDAAGVEYDRRWGAKKLADLAEANGIQTGADEIEVEVIRANVWTSKGKFLEGQTVSLSQDEIDLINKDMKRVINA